MAKVPDPTEPFKHLIDVEKVVRSTHVIGAHQLAFQPLPPPHEAVTAANTEVMSDTLQEVAGLLAQSMELNRRSLENSNRVERFSRRMSIASFWVSAASLAVAIVSVVIAVTAIVATR